MFLGNYKEKDELCRDLDNITTLLSAAEHLSHDFEISATLLEVLEEQACLRRYVIQALDTAVNINFKVSGEHRPKKSIEHLKRKLAKCLRAQS